MMIFFLFLGFSDVSYSLEIPFFQSSPIIDGEIENVWENATRIDKLIEVLPKEGEIPPVKTEILLGYDLNAIYIAFICFDDISSIIAHNVKKDACFSDDRVAIDIDTYRKREFAYTFQVNPLGSQIDGKSYQSISEQNSDFIWEAKGKIYDDRWVVEIKIPFSSIEFPKCEEQVWRIQFYRVRPRVNNEIYCWYPTGSDFSHFLDDMGEIRFKIKKPLFSFNLYPYLLSSYTSFSQTKDTSYTNYRAGITGDIILSSNSHILFSFIPDHKEIESDYPVISVNTKTAIGYPEKRPFFQKGEDLFNFPMYLFYSRIINDPYLTLKFFSKGERFDMGFLSAYNRNSMWIIPVGEYSSYAYSSLNSLINIFTTGFKWGEGSYIKCLLSHRGIDGGIEDGSQILYGINGDLYITKDIDFYGSLFNSRTKEIIDTSLIIPSYLPDSFDGKYTTEFDGESFSGIGFNGGITFNLHRFYTDFYTEQLSPTFRCDNGFLSENNERRYYLKSYISFYPNKGGINNIRIGIDCGLINTYNNEFLYNYITPYFSFTLPLQTEFQISYKSVKEVFQDETFNKPFISTSINSSIMGLIGINGNFIFGKQIYYSLENPDLERYLYKSIGITLTPIKYFGVGISYTGERLGEIYDLYTLITSARISYKTNYFRWVGYYNGQDKSYYFFPLFSFFNKYGELYIGGSSILPEKSRKFSFYQMFVKFSLEINLRG
uniref:Carbohydrate-binding domain-containing protein n=1 Tax=candidate division WOR-3 bacterium TaxID=2052148 RepID=A0A7C4Y5W7_UNCW3